MSSWGGRRSRRWVHPATAPAGCSRGQLRGQQAARRRLAIARLRQGRRARPPAAAAPLRRPPPAPPRAPGAGHAARRGGGAEGARPGGGHHGEAVQGGARVVPMWPGRVPSVQKGARPCGGRRGERGQRACSACGSTLPRPPSSLLPLSTPPPGRRVTGPPPRNPAGPVPAVWPLRMESAGCLTTPALRRHPPRRASSCSLICATAACARSEGGGLGAGRGAGPAVGGARLGPAGPRAPAARRPGGGLGRLRAGLAAAGGPGLPLLSWQLPARLSSHPLQVRRPEVHAEEAGGGSD